MVCDWTPSANPAEGRIRGSLSTTVGPLAPREVLRPQDYYSWASAHRVVLSGGRASVKQRVVSPGYAAGRGRRQKAAALAMERFLQQKEGPHATLLEMLRRDVFRPTGVHQFAAGTVYTPNGAEGFPLTAWGAMPTLDTLAKAGTLVANGGKSPHGRQILDPDLIAGLYGANAYQLSFWNILYTNPAAKNFPVPYMLGGGGNLVFCMPNGMVGITLGNNFGTDWSSADKLSVIDAANTIKPF